ncbi:MAG: hypothetical protein AAGG50_09660 [Bacteroidota bacterium]
MPTSTLTLRAPRAFSPSASLLGRGLRRMLGGDPIRAEAVYWVALVLVVAVAVMGTQWGWLWLRDASPPEEFLAAAVWYAVAQAIAVVVFVGVGYVGWRPRVEVTLTPETLRIQQGRVALEIPRTSLRALRTIEATEEHRTLRRRADVRRFVAKAYDPLLVLDVDGQPPIVLALPSAERERFEQALGPLTLDLRPSTFG